MAYKLLIIPISLLLLIRCANTNYKKGLLDRNSIDSVTIQENYTDFTLPKTVLTEANLQKFITDWNNAKSLGAWKIPNQNAEITVYLKNGSKRHFCGISGVIAEDSVSGFEIGGEYYFEELYYANALSAKHNGTKEANPH